MQIIKGKIPSAKKVIVYGPEGIGKSTFAAKFPDPLFIDTEGSTKDMDVSRTPAPSSFSMLLDQVRYVKEHPEVCRTLVIDTADWAEMLCIEQICRSKKVDSLEGFGYGKGYVYVQEEFGRLLNLLTEVIDTGVNVVLTAHAKLRKFEQPDEMGAYDRWEMKLTRQVAPMVKEWADMVLFANYKTMVYNVDGQGAQKGKNKAQGGRRVMYTSHHPCWDAKNRYGLAEEVAFDYGEIAHILGSGSRQEAQKEPPVAPTAPTNEKQENTLPDFMHMETMTSEEAQAAPPPVPTSAVEKAPEAKTPSNGPVLPGFSKNIPKPLLDLMQTNSVHEWEIMEVVGARGYYPPDTQIDHYDPDFVNGVLVGAWPQVYQMILDMRKKEGIPFNK